MSYQTQTPTASFHRKITLDDTRSDLPPGTSTYAQVTQPAFVYDLPQKNASAVESTVVKPVTLAPNSTPSQFSNGLLFQGFNGVNPYHLPPASTATPTSNPIPPPISNHIPNSTPNYYPNSTASTAATFNPTSTPTTIPTSPYQPQYNPPKPAPITSSQTQYVPQPYTNPQTNHISTNYSEGLRTTPSQTSQGVAKAGQSSQEDELAAINLINRASDANLLRQREQNEQKSGGILPSFPHIDQTKITEPVSIPLTGGHDTSDYYGQEAKGDSGAFSGSVMTFLPQTVVNKVDTTMREMKG